MKFLIYKGSGGLTHMLKGLTKALVYAKLQNRFLIIDCKQHKGFKNNFSDFFIIDNPNIKWGEDYNVIPEDLKFYNIPARKIKEKNYNFINNKYYVNGVCVSIIDNSDRLVTIFCNSFNKVPYSKIKVNSKIKEEILKNEPINEKYIAVHYRNTDIKNNIYDILRKILYFRNIKTVYLATDDCNSYNIIKNKLPNDYKIIQKTIPENFKGKNIHYQTEDKRKLIMNCLIDIYYCINSTIFIPCMNSGLSKWIIHMMKTRKNIFDI